MRKRTSKRFVETTSIYLTSEQRCESMEGERERHKREVSERDGKSAFRKANCSLD